MEVKAYHRVNFYDTDAMGVVHHANYIRWFEIGRVEFLRALGITLGSGKFDDELAIVTRPTALTKVKMAFDYEVRRVANDALLVLGHTQNVFTSRETGRITKLPAEFYEKLHAALSEDAPTGAENL